MNLFINAVVKKWVLILFDDNRNIIFQKEIEVAWNESEKLIWLVDDFLKKSHLWYDDLENLVVVAWPGSFTWIRTIVLMVNTINFVIDKNITSISFFDLFNNYSIVKTSSKRDCFLKKDINSEIEIISNIDLIDYLLKNNINKIYGDFNPWDNKGIELIEKINYSDIIKNIKFQKEKIIEPLYIKKPSIS